MPNRLALPVDPVNIPGVVSVAAEAGRMVVTFCNGVTATVARSPFSAFSRRESFDVWLPPSQPGTAANGALSKNPAEVIAMLTELAAKAAAH